jgi:CubicO group peptidase (beta-lactamase class C family)
MTRTPRSRFATAALTGIGLAARICSAVSIPDQIDALLRQKASSAQFNGTVLVAMQSRVVYERAFGSADFEWNVPNDLQTKFEIGSMTKQFTAMLVLQLVNEQRLRLGGHISDYLPYYRVDTAKRVTLHELLSHTSGIPNFLTLPGFLDGPASRMHYSPESFIRKFCSGDLQFEPGSKFEYSNSGYFILGAILERVTGKSYESLLRERIFQPLGMKDSGYAHTEALIPHRARGYERSGRGVSNARFYDMSIPFSAGALYSTVEDLYKWDQALYTERLLPAAYRELLFRPNLDNYGYGWALLIPKLGQPFAGEPIPMHGGAIFGFQSLIQRIPRERDLIVLLDNTDDPTLLSIAMQIRGIISPAASKGQERM